MKYLKRWLLVVRTTREAYTLIRDLGVFILMDHFANGLDDRQWIVGGVI